MTKECHLILWQTKRTLLKKHLKNLIHLDMSISVHKVIVWKFPEIWNARIALTENSLLFLQNAKFILFSFQLQCTKLPCGNSQGFGMQGLHWQKIACYCFKKPNLIYFHFNFSAQSYRVDIPRDLECKDCTVRLVRQALEWGKRYLFWSCGDVDIIPARKYAEDCSGKAGSFMVCRIS